MLEYLIRQSRAETDACSLISTGVSETCFLIRICLAVELQPSIAAVCYAEHGPGKGWWLL